MREYELTYLISDNVPESELNKVTGKVGGYITNIDGKVLKEEIWGRRKLAYPIKKQEFATYVTVNFNISAEKAHEFEQNIELTSKIVRHLLIVKDFNEKKLTLTVEDIAKTKEIKEVIGGEKSFEAIEGETEESKNLMAIREQEEKEKEKISKPLEKTDEIKTEEPKKIDKVSTETETSVSTRQPIIDEGSPISRKSKAEEKPTKEKIEEKADKQEKEIVKKAPKKKEDEADRLSKLDKELDEILGEDL